ncbi:MAG: hypothetical protein KC620_06620 [Myxococcales bacterium]|nr:hypothetical protein [Myxococcales bacterium]
MRHARLPLIALFLVGFGPFQCDDSAVESARGKLRTAEAQGALDALADVDDDAAEVHLARGLAHLALQQHDDAKSALDQAYRRVAELDAKLAADAVAQGREAPPLAARPTASLRARIAFARGLVAIAKEDWDTAMVEFGRVLEIDPDDEDARWNLELAWHRANPPCHKREDDHEPDDRREDAKPFDPEQAKENRLLCPGNEDWYSLEAERDAILFVTLTGELVKYEDDEAREVTLRLYGPDEDSPIREAPLVDGKATVGVTGVPTTGTWHVQIAGPGTAEVKYGLKVEVVPPCPVDDQLEENDGPASAHALQDGEQGGLKACPGDADWYKIEVPANEARQVQVAFDPERAPLEAALFDAAGENALAVATSGKGGLAINIAKAEEAQTMLVRVATTTDRENTYALKVGPPDGGGGDNQDQKDQDQQDQDQQDQDQQNQDQNQQNQPQPKEPEPQQPQEMDLDRLIDALDQHDRNPQLEKALRELGAAPQMEDY